MRRTRVICCLVAMLATVACMVLPIIGANRFFVTFRLPYSRELHLRLLGGQVIGPAFSMAFCIFLLWAFLSGKRFPWWIATIGLIGPFYTAWAAGECSHDFSHAVFSECGNIYSDVITWLSILSGLGLFLICIHLRFEEKRGQDRPLVREVLFMSAVLAYSLLLVGWFYNYLHPALLVAAPALVTIGIVVRRRFWPEPAKAAAAVVIVLSVCFAMVLGLCVADGGSRSFGELVSDSARIMALYCIWLWLPFVAGVALGGIRGMPSKPGLVAQADAVHPSAFPDPR